MSQGKKHNELIQKLWKDAKFKKEFLKDPKKYLAEAYGTKLPDDIKIEVVEETKGKHYFVLPVNPADYGNDLSDAQLEEVAGGTMGIGATITFGTATAC